MPEVDHVLPGTLSSPAVSSPPHPSDPPPNPRQNDVHRSGPQVAQRPGVEPRNEPARGRRFGERRGHPLTLSWPAMPGGVTTATRELGDSRVRVEVEVASEALEHELGSAARSIGRDLKIPGFRKGKVPAEVVLRRVGRDAVLDEAVRRALPGWYEQAVADAGIVAVGDPRLDLTELPDPGSPLQFSIEVGVRPKAKLGKYQGLEVGRREPEVPPEAVDAELERLREAAASLENV